MTNVLIFQPFSTKGRAHLSDTIERQFRLLKNHKNIETYILLDSRDDKSVIKELENSWVKPIIVENLTFQFKSVISDIVKRYNIEILYLMRPYFTPYTEENVKVMQHLVLNGRFPEDWQYNEDLEFRYIRNLIPLEFAKYGVSIQHYIYDPLEFKYDDFSIANYRKYSSMINVPNALPSLFAEFGYYDKGKEVDFANKIYNFTFGGTSINENRTRLLQELYDKINFCIKSNVYIKVPDFNNVIDNSLYEDIVSKSLFTYTIPSQDPRYVSYTRMLLALSQGTIPLAHPDNNFECLFGRGFELRDKGLRTFLEELIISIDDLQILLNSNTMCEEKYKYLLDLWHSTDYYRYLQENT